MRGKPSVPSFKLPKRRKSLGKRIRREIRSLRRWTTLFLALRAWFRFNEKRTDSRFPPGPS